VLKKHKIALSFDFEWPDTTELGQKYGMDPTELERVRAILIGKVRDELLPLLRKYSVKATFFCVGKLVAEMPELIREIARDGHELASHGFTHRKFSVLSEDERRWELRQLDEAFALVGIRPQGFRAPTFSISSTDSSFFKLLTEHGYAYDSSLYPRKTPLYGESGLTMLPFRTQTGMAISVWEIPIPLPEIGGVRLPFGGGIYLRFLPLFSFKLLLKWLSRKTTPVIYLHPWELWPETTGRLSTGGVIPNLLHSGFSSRMMRKLESILQSCTCVTCRELVPEQS
jgi:polysaccharide deacetylase family protein (PEP-CTERM system associated)